MTSYFSRERNSFELYHNGIKIDSVRLHVDSVAMMEFYEKLIGPKGRNLFSKNSFSKPQDKGKYHIHYIRMLANEIYMEKNSEVGDGEISWNDCLKIALLLHRSKLKDGAMTPLQM